MIDKDLLKYTKGKNYYLIFITLLSFLLLIVSASSSFLFSSSIDLFIKNENRAYIYLFSSFGLVVLFIIFYVLKGKLSIHFYIFNLVETLSILFILAPVSL